MGNDGVEDLSIITPRSGNIQNGWVEMYVEECTRDSWNGAKDGGHLVRCAALAADRHS